MQAQWDSNKFMRKSKAENPSNKLGTKQLLKWVTYSLSGLSDLAMLIPSLFNCAEPTSLSWASLEAGAWDK